MFITEREILEETGFTVTRQVLNLAQMMVESFVGRVEADVNNSSDSELLAQAVMFQAIYLEEQPKDVLVQAAVKASSNGDSSMSFNTNMSAPFMAPFAVMACKRVSWNKTRSVHTGKTIQNGPKNDSFYKWTHDIGVV